ncbi:hypothetical protein [Streptomyces griseoflavus]|uniref:hypothetical protein n=1 Tax=Streptomyces griseoflavus TaxID=35619 RepID=UPI0001B4DBFB|nr:hypothetical protein [Streptomyces griseoflavus]
MTAAEEEPVAEEFDAATRLTTLRLVLQGRRVFEDMREPATPEELERRERRRFHEGMARQVERERLDALSQRDLHQGDRDWEYHQAQVHSSVWPDCPAPSLPFTDEKRAEFRAWLDAYRVRRDARLKADGFPF